MLGRQTRGEVCGCTADGLLTDDPGRYQLPPWYPIRSHLQNSQWLRYDLLPEKKKVPESKASPTVDDLEAPVGSSSKTSHGQPMEGATRWLFTQPRRGCQPLVIQIQVLYTYIDFCSSQTFSPMVCCRYMVLNEYNHCTSELLQNRGLRTQWSDSELQVGNYSQQCQCPVTE